ncbi:unnamed protein product [Blepharisma stoltei]|uniref:Acyl carrier protein n=1 Tax=Blepharisma stoltei TaxID=1481888 RepID=A0AAU9J658_9CILI|nr:unnamed protein product [Blepharisma stoltei]
MFLAKRIARLTLKRMYQADYVVMPRYEGHWKDPEEVTKRLINIVRAHDRITDPSTVTPDVPFSQLGLDDLDLVEIFLEVEKDFFMEFGDEQVERFKSINDAVEVISNYRYVDSY